MLESTNVSYIEVLDNVDTYGSWIANTDMNEYEQAFKNDNVK